MDPAPLRIALTPGEPAGIGPDLAAAAVQRPCPHERIVIADTDLMAERAARLGYWWRPYAYTPQAPPRAQAAGEVATLHVPTAAPVQPGRLERANAAYVLQTLAQATDGCLDERFAALVTAPVHKGIINAAGHPFTGHTEFLGERSGAQPVMLLVADSLRVALATTHLPLHAVPDALTGERLERVTRILHTDLQRRFGIERPRLLVLGLNPHAGEGGHLGHEEGAIIEPALARLRAEGIDATGPVPADTAFTPRSLSRADAVLAMYHDQGLPVLKHAGFGRAVNVTLGLPLVRTSVDHGTALDLAGTGDADSGSLIAALALAADLATRT